MKQKPHQLISLMLCFALLFPSFSFATQASDTSGIGLSNFKKQQEYLPSTFSDVPAPWVPFVRSAFELDLMKGRGEHTFHPKEYITVAEVVSMASSLHSIYYLGKRDIKKVGSLWYDGAVSYACDHSIITGGALIPYEAPATRAELASIFSKALPEKEFAPINRIKTLPDVTGSAPFDAAVLKLYNAGILTGTDAYGTFLPDQPITRAEAAVILTRLVLPTERKKLTLLPVPKKPLPAKVFHSAHSDYTLTASAVWQPTDPPVSRDSTLELCSPGDSAYIVVNCLSKDALSLSLKECSTGFYTTLSKTMEQVTAVKQKDFTLSGQPAILSTFMGKMNGVSLRYWLLTIDGPHAYTQLSAFCPGETAEQNEAEILSVLYSFTLQNQRSYHCYY